MTFAHATKVGMLYVLRTLKPNKFDPISVMDSDEINSVLYDERVAKQFTIVHYFHGSWTNEFQTVITLPAPKDSEHIRII